MIEGSKVFDQPVKTHIRTYEKNQKNNTCQEDNYTIGCLLEYL